MTAVLGSTALTIVRIDLDLALPTARHAEAGDVAARALAAAGVAHDAVSVSDQGVAVEITLDQPDDPAGLPARLAAWRVHLEALPARGASLPLVSLSARADALTAEPSPLPVGVRLAHAPARVLVGCGDEVASTSITGLEDRLAVALAPTPAAPDSVAGARTAAPAPEAVARGGRGWFRMAEGSGTGSLALVRHHRPVPPAHSLAEHLADRVILSAFADADGVLAAEVRGTGLSYRPRAELRDGGSPAVLLIETEVAAGDEIAADLALTRARARFAASFDAAAALARARARVVVEADTLRGLLEAESRRRWRAVHVDDPDAAADDDTLLDRLAAPAVAARAAELFRANDFDALVLSPDARPDEWEEL